MAAPIFLLNFRRGTVEALDEAVRPSGVRDPSSTVEPEQLAAASGYVLAALGTPPRVRESNSHVSPGPPTRVRRDAAGNTRKEQSARDAARPPKQANAIALVGTGTGTGTGDVTT